MTDTARVAVPRTTVWTLTSAFDAICRLEEKHDLLRHTVDGWAVWPLYRHPLMRLLLSQAQSGLQPVLSRAQRLRFAVQDGLKFAGIRRHDIAIARYNSALLDERNGRFVDMHFHELASLLGDVFRIQVLNNLEFEDRRDRAAVPADMTTAGIDLLTGILSRRAPALELTRAATAIATAIQQEFGVDAMSPESAAVILRYFFHGQRLYRSLFWWLRPSLLIVSDQMQYAMVAGARRAGVPVVELQHGIVNRTHATYAWTGYAREYRSTMPVPDHIFLYGEHWRTELDRDGFWGSSLRVTGSPYLDHYRRRRAVGDETVVVFAAQGGTDTATAADWLRDAMRVTDPALRLYVRLHPQYAGVKDEFIRALGHDNRVTILAAHESPSTFELLARASLHVSIYSSTHYDAVGLGVPTVILPLKMHEFVMPLHRAGHALLADSPQALAGFFRAARSLRVPEGASEYYYRSSSLEHTLRAIDDIRGGERR